MMPPLHTIGPSLSDSHGDGWACPSSMRYLGMHHPSWGMVCLPNMLIFLGSAAPSHLSSNLPRWDPLPHTARWAAPLFAISSSPAYRIYPPLCAPAGGSALPPCSSSLHVEMVALKFSSALPLLCFSLLVAPAHGGGEARAPTCSIEARAPTHGESEALAPACGHGGTPAPAHSGSRCRGLHVAAHLTIGVEVDQ